MWLIYYKPCLSEEKQLLAFYKLFCRSLRKTKVNKTMHFQVTEEKKFKHKTAKTQLLDFFLRKSWFFPLTDLKPQ